MEWLENDTFCKVATYHRDREDRLLPIDLRPRTLYVARFLLDNELAINFPISVRSLEASHTSSSYHLLRFEWYDEDLLPKTRNNAWLPMYDDGLLQSANQDSLSDFEAYIRDYNADEAGQTIQAINAAHKLGKIIIDPKDL